MDLRAVNILPRRGNCILILALLCWLSACNHTQRTQKMETNQIESQWDERLGINIPDDAFIYFASLERQAGQVPANMRLIIRRNNEMAVTFNGPSPDLELVDHFNRPWKEYRRLGEDEMDHLKAQLDSLDLVALSPLNPTPENLTVFDGYNHYLYLAPDLLREFGPEHPVGEHLHSLLFHL